MIRLLSHLGLLLLLLFCGDMFTSEPAQALVVSCSVTSSSINFGIVNVSPITGITGTGSISYTCTNVIPINPENFTICATLGTPSSPGTVSQPAMLAASSSASVNFNLYTNAPNGTVWTSTTYVSAPVTIPANVASVSGSLSFYGAIPGSQTSAADTYAARFTTTSLSFLNGSSCSGLLLYAGQTFTLPVAAVVSKTCIVSAAADLNFGNVASNATGITGSTTIGVTCPTSTVYNVGLSPSNASTTGAGIMSSTVGGTDTVPYQLRSVSTSGPVWGNTATSVSVGNGVAGTGNGLQQSLTVYGTVPSANYTPGAYADTVTINVNY